MSTVNLPTLAPQSSSRSAPVRLDTTSQPEPIRVAVVGAGYIADYHLQILTKTPGVEVVAVCDLDLERARSAQKTFGIAHGVARPRELVDLGIQVAHVLVPPEYHVDVARDLLEQGIGVFVEKPLALQGSAARELVELARERGLPLGVNHNARFHPAFAQLLERVRRGDIGRVEHVQVTLSVPLRQLDAGDYSHWMFRRPANIVFEQAPHPFSQLVELVGEVRESRTTLLGTRELNPGQIFHDRWLFSARGSKGATVEAYLAFGQDFTRSTLQVLGSDGSVEADLHHNHFSFEEKTPWLEFWNTFLAGWRRGRELKRSARRGAFYWFRQTLGLGGREDAFYAGMRDSIGAFYGALRAGQSLPVDGETGAQVLDWCEAAVKELTDPGALETIDREPGDARTGEVCVIGGTGFIGKRTVQGLRQAGLPVSCTVRRRHTLPPEIAQGAKSGDVRLLNARLEDPDSLRAAIRGAKVVLHLATGGGDTWQAVERAMIGGTVAVAEACLDEGVERLVYVSSTAALYMGPDCGEETLSDAGGPDPRPEKRPLYARGKIRAEEELMRLHRERGLRVTIVRPSVVLGPGTPMQHSGLGLWVRDNHCVGWGQGDRPLPLVLADDVADALVRLAAHEGSDLDGKAMNLSSRSMVSAQETVEYFRSATGRALNFHPRSMWLSQTMEIGKWIVKKVGGRRDAEFPSYRDLKSRSLYPGLACETARNVLGWKPCDDPEELLARTLSEPSDQG